MRWDLGATCVASSIYAKFGLNKVANSRNLKYAAQRHDGALQAKTYRVHQKSRPCILIPSHSNLQKKGELEYWLTEHLRLNGVYWGLTALFLLGEPHALDRDETIMYVLSCQTEEGTSAH